MAPLNENESPVDAESAVSDLPLQEEALPLAPTAVRQAVEAAVSAGHIYQIREEVEAEISAVESPLSFLRQLVDIMPDLEGTPEEKMLLLEEAIYGPGVGAMKPILWDYFEGLRGSRQLDAHSLSNLNLEVAFPDMDVISVDLGAFAKFDDNSSTDQKIRVQQSLERISIYAEREFGVYPLKARAGDCYVWGLKRLSGNKREDNRRLLAVVSWIMSEVESIEMPVEVIKHETKPDGETPLYTIVGDKAYFKATAVVVRAPEGSVKTSMHTGTMESGQGHTRLRGASFAKVLKLEKGDVTKGHIKFPKAYAEEINSQGIPGVNVSEAGEMLPLTIHDLESGVELSGPALLSGRTQSVSMLARLYALAAAAQASCQDGGPKRFVDRRGTGRLEGLSAEPGLVCIGFQVGSVADEVERPDVYSRFYQEYYKIVSRPRFANRFEVMKQDEGWMIISSRKNGHRLDLTNGKDVKLLIDYKVEVAALLRKFALPVRVSASGESTRFSIPVQGKMAEEMIWGDVVTNARLVKGMPDDLVCLHSSVCLRSSGSLALQELIKKFFKGIGVVQFLAVDPDNARSETIHDRMIAQDLFGVESIMKHLRACAENPENLGSISLLPPVDDLEGRGYGGSAVARHMVSEFNKANQENETNLKAVYITPVEGSVIRGILQQFMPQEYAKLENESEVVPLYRTFLANNISALDGYALAVDPMGQSDATQDDLLRETIELMKGRNCFMLWVDGEGKPLHLHPMTPGSAAKLMLQMNGVDYKRTGLVEMVEQAIQKLKLSQPLKARFVVHTLSKAMRITYNEDKILRIDFDPKMIASSAAPSALAAFAEDKKLSTAARGLYGLIAKIGVEMPLDKLFELESQTLNGITKKRFKQELNRLCDIGWVTHNQELDTYEIADSNQSESAMELHSYDFNSGFISSWLIENKLVSLTAEFTPTDVNRVEAEYLHLLEDEKHDGPDKVRRMEVLGGSLALRRFRRHQLADARQVYWDFIGKTSRSGRICIPQGLNSTRINFYLTMAQVMLQSEEARDHELANQIFEYFIGYRGVSGMDRARAFNGISRLIARKTTNRNIQAVDVPVHLKEGLKEDLIPRTIALHGEVGAYRGLINFMNMVPTLNQRNEGLAHALIIKAVQLSAVYSSLEIVNRVTEMSSINRDSLRGEFEEIQSFLASNQEALETLDVYEELKPTIKRLSGGCRMNFGESESARADFVEALDGYDELQVPDFKQAHDAVYGALLIDWRNVYKSFLSYRRAQSTSEKEKLSQEMMMTAVGLYNDLVKLKKRCIREGDLYNWEKSLLSIGNVCLLLVYLAADMPGYGGDTMKNMYKYGSQALDEQRLVLERLGRDTETLIKARADLDDAARACNFIE